MPNRIVVLDADVATKIAAGEVIERPASVVKELVENSIDAGASRIIIESEEGGKKLIKVSDDGVGMSREDAVLAFQRHATSKIRTESDLERIITLGFRGEALPSIAAVSQVELVTREAESDIGTKVVVEGGIITEVKDIGCPKGTTVTMRSLFFNTPARLKFVKSAQAELSHITDIVARFILSHPHLSFSLHHGGRELLNHVGTSEERAALAVVLGRDAVGEMVPIGMVMPNLKISGFVSKPTLTKANRTGQFFFVNRRPVRSRALQHAVFHAYQGLIPSERHPVCVVLIDIEPSLVDVNVHPQKREVRFEREWEVHSALVQAIRQALTAGQLVPEISQRIQVATSHQPSSQELTAFRHALKQQRWSSEPTHHQPSAISHQPLASLLPRKLKPISQLRNTYILAEGEDGLFIVSQHRAHERVLFERFLKTDDDGIVASQGLVVPFTLTLGQGEAAFVEENIDVFRRAGFDIEPFGGQTFIIRCVPALLARRNYEEAIRDLIEELLLGSAQRPLQDRFAHIKATLACKSAIKAGESLSLPEMERLLDDLFATSSPFLCPHEQPIVVSLSAEELDRRFERR